MPTPTSKGIFVNPQTLLSHIDSGELWTTAPSEDASFNIAQAYRDALAVRALRIARGEVPRGFKIGFTNRNIWQRYGVYGPIWGTVYTTSLSFCEGEGVVSLKGTCQPRLEHEAVFGMRVTPPANASLDDLFDSLEWVAPGFEVVQSHLPDWKFKAPDTVADGGLHARLLVGRKVPVAQIASSASQLNEQLAAAQVHLIKGGMTVESGCGANVLDGPLLALQYFLKELRACPGAVDLLAGDVITTGTWTDAWPVLPGETWTADFGHPLSRLQVEFA
jgi:2-oxo-3-hexenedioate decarboxylase